MTAVGDDVSGEETKCFRVASPAGEEEEDLDLTAERNMELRALALEAGMLGVAGLCVPPLCDVLLSSSFSSNTAKCKPFQPASQLFN